MRLKWLDAISKWFSARDLHYRYSGLRNVTFTRAAEEDSGKCSTTVLNVDGFI